MGMPLASSCPVMTNETKTESTMARSSSELRPEGARQAALQLFEERKAIDEEMEGLMQVLKANNVTMSSPLVDSEGFPDASIDVAAVRTARARMIALRNDRDELGQRMRQMLDVALARQDSSSHDEDFSLPNDRLSLLPSTAMAQVPGTNGGLSMSVPIRRDDGPDAWVSVGGLVPFAKVNSVASQSPAALADLRVHDQILQFGHLTSTNVHRVPSQRDMGNLLSAVVSGVTVEVTILRLAQAEPAVATENGLVPQSSVRTLRLTPSSSWAGRGLLGCHLLPM